MDKRLYRSKKDRMIAGVCSGIAEYLDIDPTVIRILYVLLTVFTSFLPGIIAYLLLWLIIPEEPEKPPQSVLKDTEEKEEIQKNDEGYTSRKNTSKALSIAIIVLGATFVIYGIFKLISIIGGWWIAGLHWHIPFGVFSPIISVVLGVILIIIGLNKDK